MMSEHIECDGCGARMTNPSPRLWKIEQVGEAALMGEATENHACSPACIETIGARKAYEKTGIGRETHYFNPERGFSTSYGPDPAERHQETIWGDLRGGGVRGFPDQIWHSAADRAMGQVPQPGYRDPSLAPQSKGRAKPGPSRRDPPPDSLVQRLSSSFKRCFGL